MLIPIKRCYNEKYRANLERKHEVKLPELEEIVEVSRKIGVSLNCFYLMDNVVTSDVCMVKEFTILYSVVETCKEGYFEINEIKEYIKKQDNLVKERNYVRLFNILDKRFMVKLFVKHYKKIPNEQFHEVFAMVYSHIERGYDELAFCMNKVKRFAPKVDQKIFGEHINADGFITIYRGENEFANTYQNAFAWTLDKKVALFFGKRFGEMRAIYKAKVHVEDIITYLDRRDESTVLVFPESIKDVEMVENTEEFLKLIKEREENSEPVSIVDGIPSEGIGSIAEAYKLL